MSHGSPPVCCTFWKRWNSYFTCHSSLMWRRLGSNAKYKVRKSEHVAEEQVRSPREGWAHQAYQNNLQPIEVLLSAADQFSSLTFCKTHQPLQQPPHNLFVQGCSTQSWTLQVVSKSPTSISTAIHSYILIGPSHFWGGCILKSCFPTQSDAPECVC